ncbi:hypothetical protein BHE74_00031881 [Ensete ventricosum]|uniref:Uncharacterized protein n=1 Tax=Ensete ventricosum TaxID=4639 RepID=A0A427A0H0_ENSVE|nr:hypothetical protein B296_00032859 [Ensete ventricosum]RWW61105.1 hypothetical protein BHE74_00031881 [Ensete ventricosum]
MSPVVEAAKEYAAGFAAGVATVITGHPFDTVKVRAIPPPPPFHHFLHRNLSHSFVRRTDSLGFRFPLFFICPLVLLDPVRYLPCFNITKWVIILFMEQVKLQAHNTKTQVKEYKNALHCTSRILITEGVCF